MSTKNQLTTLTLLLFFGLYSLAQTPDLPSDVDGVSLSWFEQVQKDLSEREYVLHQNQTNTNQYRAFNRSNGLIGQLKPGSMSLTPNPDSGQTATPWQAELQTTANI